MYGINHENGESTAQELSTEQLSKVDTFTLAKKFKKKTNNYISHGPLATSCGLASSAVEQDLEKWKSLGDFLIGNLGFPARKQLSDAQRLRIFRYYLPVFFWCQRQLAQHRAAVAAVTTPKRPLVIGMQAPQGCGKTTLVEQLEALFEHEGMRTAGVSIDDFYLTYADQQALARANPGNRLLQVRGNAGTHDVALGGATLRALAAAGAPPGAGGADASAGGSTTAPSATVAVPRYDKSAHGGRGDRAAPGKWPRVKGPLDLVLFEGWMLGFRPVGAAAAAEVDADLGPIDAAMHSYESAWDAHVDAWLVVKVGTPEWVYRWRLEAEHAMRASGRPGMSDKQVADFVDRYMPAYHAYLPGMYASGPTTARAEHVLVVEIDETRSLTPAQPGPFCGVEGDWAG
ncbi:hypothetical protein WJX81_005787 [Elliptochloris bilobata]|uniref:Glycerate kinase n=1 Tax=Elliptochloris bilobata TaxID=381761 RepID=A0AAW1S6E9_9CHLO